MKQSLLFGCLVCLFGLLAPQTFAEGPVFKVGAAMADITAPLGYQLCGYYCERPATAVHDPLHAKILAFREGEKSAILIVCDLESMPKHLSDAVRDGIAAKVPVKRELIAMTATHTHTGPEFNERTGDYEKTLVEATVAAAVKAYESAQEAIVESGSAQITDLSFNRRFFMKDGPVQFNPGFNNPNIVRPAGGIDPECPIVLFKEAKTGKPFASLANFALHLDTTGGSEYSADYPYYASEVLKKKYGEDFIAVFGTGTCGDINHLDFAGNTPIKHADQIGTILGERLAARIDEGLEVENASLDAITETVEIPRQQFTDEQIADAEANADIVFDPELAQKRGKGFLDQAWYGKVLAIYGWPEKIEMDIQGVRISDNVAFVTMPGEVFVDLGQAIKKGSPFARTMVIELANQCIQYVPTEKAFGEGSYETINSSIAPGGGEMMADYAVEILNRMEK